MSESDAIIRKGVNLGDRDAIAASIGAVVDYRGDVTITRAGGQAIEGYVFDADETRVRLLPKDGGSAVTVPMTEIGAIDVTGRDTAEGKSFETWVRKYVEKMRADGRV